MHWLRKTSLSMTCAVALCSCATGGKPVLCPAQVTPQLRPIPAEMLAPGNYEQRVREILFKSAPTPTPPAAGTSPN